MKNQTSERKFLTVKQLSERWQCSEKNIRRLIWKNELQAHRFGRLIRIGPDEIDTYERLNRM